MEQSPSAPLRAQELNAVTDTIDRANEARDLLVTAEPNLD
jgi:hypothetical protein